MSKQQTDADLIRSVERIASDVQAGGNDLAADDLRRAAARLSELTQPAPLALSAEDAVEWSKTVAACGEWKSHGLNPPPNCRAILAVDAILRRRVTDEWLEERFTTHTLNAETVNAFFRGEA